MKLHTKTLLASLTATAMLAGSATAATYTYNGSADATDLTNTGNWAGGSILPNAEANAALDIVAPASGTQGGTTGLSGIRTVGSITNNSGGNVRFDQVGNWNTNTQTGWVFDTGSAANATIAAGSQLYLYYAPMTLTSDVEIVSGHFIFRSYGSRYGVQGGGGFIINNGAELEIDATHGSGVFNYSGGVTVKSGGVLDIDSNAMGSLGTGLLTVEEGGVVQAHNSSFQNDVLFNLTSAGSVDALITGGGNANPENNWGVGGEWTFDLSAADKTVGNTWNIVGIGDNASYDTDGLDGDDFSVAGATRDGSGVWSGINSGATFEYSESTGVLSIVVPEPGSLALLGLGGLLIGARRRRG